ncbi:NADAR family protein [Acinetobacter sp. ME22]|uniref:NADAR family protein n=1 Tax=Acinetobacter sp. ME22 TaxID=2904802 RepID=UPI001EDC83F5|nr:NADAR family protein [Acinetobacter sp. ME22]MCG2572049.1 NADAR family protein [Acinetobacter sp. ME22]
MDKLAERIYDPKSQELAIFKKTHEEWGGYSNMASGYPIIINDIHIRSSEALYQALKFPDHPEVQNKILAQTSPMTAKMVGKPFREFIRSDFDLIKIRIMKWCIYAKLLSNFDKFSNLLLESGNKIIIEESSKDNFWGAKRTKDNKLIGVNVLGRILMQTRDNIRTGQIPDRLEPFKNINDFKLLGQNITTIYKSNGTVADPLKPQQSLL